jgi:hypothetical protein
MRGPYHLTLAVGLVLGLAQPHFHAQVVEISSTVKSCDRTSRTLTIVGKRTPDEISSETGQEVSRAGSATVGSAAEAHFDEVQRE